MSITKIEQPKTIMYVTNAANYLMISGNPIAYWCSDTLLSIFENSEKLGILYPTKKGLDTGDNDKYLRYWHEVSFDKVGVGFISSSLFTKAHKKWAPHDKGGDYRKWYGNKDWVINWENDGFELHNSKANLRSEKYYFHKSITWSSLSSGKASFRQSDYGAISNTAGSAIYPENNSLYLIALLNSKVTQEILDIISPTLNYSAGPISDIPVVVNNNSNVDCLSQECCETSRTDWDSNEVSWDFKKHPLI